MCAVRRKMPKLTVEHLNLQLWRTFAYRTWHFTGEDKMCYCCRCWSSWELNLFWICSWRPQGTLYCTGRCCGSCWASHYQSSLPLVLDHSFNTERLPPCSKCSTSPRSCNLPLIKLPRGSWAITSWGLTLCHLAASVNAGDNRNQDAKQGTIMTCLIEAYIKY